MAELRGQPRAHRISYNYEEHRDGVEGRITCIPTKSR
jgi:hypothetical protein